MAGMRTGRGWRRFGTNVFLTLAAATTAALACSRGEAPQPPPAASPVVPAPARIAVRDAGTDVADAGSDASDARPAGHGKKLTRAAGGGGSGGSGGSGGLKVEGSLSRADGDKVVRGAQPKLRACFDAANPAGAGHKGRVSFQMTINDRGHVTVAEIPHSTLPGGSDVETCMVHVLRDLLFPRGSGETTVSFQMSFGR
jgi:hypothetical protein